MAGIEYGYFVGKKVFLVTKAGRKYQGIVKTCDEQHISMNDKYGDYVIISISEISSLEEEKW